MPGRGGQLDCYFWTISSFATFPSRTKMMRWACRAMSCSCVTSTIVLPCWCKPLEQRHDFVAGRGVEVTGGLVGEQNRGPIHQRARDGDTLTLTTRALVRLVVHALFEID